jgi:serine/threonine-protein kinase
MLTPEEEKQLQELLDKGETTEEEVREARRLVAQAQRVGWTLSVTDALARASAALGPPQPISEQASAEDENGGAIGPPKRVFDQVPAEDENGGATAGPVEDPPGRSGSAPGQSGNAASAHLRQGDGGSAPPVIDPADLKLLEKLGRGSQAVVYKCVHGPTERVFAVKILTADAARNRESRNSFLREGRHAAQLVHPNIVRIYQVGPFKETFFIAMEYVDGGSVADLIAARGHLDAKEAVRIIRATAEGLAYAHRQGYIHRDIKPKNILMTRDGTPKLADMGLARRSSDLDAAFSEIGRAYGTPYYISPEQVRGDPDIDHRTDIYSLGVTFYEMLAGRPPFLAPSPKLVIQIMQMHLKDPVPDPRRFVREIPESLCRILGKSLAKRADKRFASAEAFIAALDKTGV